MRSFIYGIHGVLLMRRRWRLWLGLAAVLGLLALGVPYWGKGVPARYRVFSSAQVQLPGASRTWVIEPEGAPAQSWTARDTNGDGTWDEFTSPDGAFHRPSGTSPQRWLVVCLDGVPLAVMQALWDDGNFREFFRPTATVSSLPSDSETALTEVFHTAPVPGYEHRYFDRDKNAMRGGAWVTLTGIGIPYIRRLDYDTPGWAKGLPYLLPERSYLSDVNRFRAQFLATRAPVFLAHIASSDALLHVRTAEQARPLLLEFDDALRDIYLDARGSLGILVFSDHGNTQTASRAIPLEAFLGGRGWRVGDSLRAASDVVIPSYGLVGFAAVYCRPESVERLAEELRGVEGVDAIVSRDPGGTMARIRAAGSGAVAELEWSADGLRYRYSAQQGDPLGLTGAFDSLRMTGKLDAEGFAGDAELWTASISTPYPDAASRIRAWATDQVQNRADILVVLRPGYYHGASVFQDLVTLAGTHGGLERSASLGFAMATYPLPAAIRLRDLIPGDLLRRAAADRRD